MKQAFNFVYKIPIFFLTELLLKEASQATITRRENDL